MKQWSMKFSLLLLLGSVFLFPSFCLANIPQSERDALIALYNSTNGPSWTNSSGWLGAPGTENTWYGVVTDNNSSVIELDLDRNSLSGNIPQELSNLSNIVFLDLSYNDLAGNIPVSLGSLSNLHGLDLTHNFLTGSLPVELCNAAALQKLYLNENQLSGQIPAQLGNMQNLGYLLLNYNDFTGIIPPQIGSASNLRWLWLQGNQLTGNIPVELKNLSYLQHLELSGNQLNGAIPPELGDLADLQVLGLCNNQLTGTIPLALCGLVNLQDLCLSNNQLTGTIPPGLGGLVNLQELYLGANDFSGTIPVELGNLVNLRQLGLYDTQVSGPLPAELGNLTKLEGINLSENRLSGEIPATLGNLVLLQGLWLDGNALSGEIPASMENLISLNSLDLSWNALYSTNGQLTDFLNSKHWGDWRDTQTVPPGEIMVEAQTGTSMLLSWARIPYFGNTGGYKLFYSTASGGPYSLYGTTPDKLVCSMQVDGLTPGTNYCFVLKTFTEPHYHNQNALESINSEEFCALSTDCPNIYFEPDPLPGVILETPYNQTVSASGGTAPYIFSLTSGALPPGLSLDRSGAISGTPVSPGIFYFRISALDSAGCYSSMQYSIEVFAYPQAPVINSVYDSNLCEQTGVYINFDYGNPFTRTDLYVDNVLVKTGIHSIASYNPGDLIVHSYKVRAINGFDTCFTDSNVVDCADEDSGMPSQPLITGITDPDFFMFGLVLNFSPGSPAERHDLYKDGALAKENFLSGSVFNPFDSLSHDYQIVAVNGTCVNFSYPVTAADRGSRFKPRPRIPIGELPFPRQ